MIIVHVSSYKDEFFNGIKSVLAELVPEQKKLGHIVHVFNCSYNEKEVICGERYISSHQMFIDAINETKPDIVIFHSLFRINYVRFSWYLNHLKIPYLVEPHGGTSISNAQKGKIKKKIASYLFVNRFLHKAVGIIYLNKKESEECVYKKIRNGYTIIPNGTHVNFVKRNSISNNIVRFIFLARIDIIQKGLDLLFPAIEKFNNSGQKENAEFHFYGKARNQLYAKEFEEYISKASNNVFFHGPVFGYDKEKAFQNADVFILPSRYEGMPMAVLEALSYGLPCLLSRQTNVADIIEDYHCGWVTETSIDDICNTIMAAVHDYNSNCEKLRKNAIIAVKPFDWSSIAALSIKEYQRLIRAR